MKLPRFEEEEEPPPPPSLEFFSPIFARSQKKRNKNKKNERKLERKKKERKFHHLDDTFSTLEYLIFLSSS
jgi:hypothetical protein